VSLQACSRLIDLITQIIFASLNDGNGSYAHMLTRSSATQSKHRVSYACRCRPAKNTNNRHHFYRQNNFDSTTWKMPLYK